MLLRLLATFLYVCSTGFAVCVGAATEEDFLWGHIPLTNSKHKALVCKVNVVTPESYRANRRKYLERERVREGKAYWKENREEHEEEIERRDKNRGEGSERVNQEEVKEYNRGETHEIFSSNVNA